MKATTFRVLYRDAGNNKQGTTLTFAGEPTDAEIAALRGALDEALYVIPTQVGLAHLGSTLTAFPTEDDHVWHELDLDEMAVQDVPDPILTDNRSVTEFVEAVVAASTAGWDEFAAMTELDIPDSTHVS